MPGTPGYSGGANRKSVEEHLLHGTFKPSRHLKPAPSAPVPVASADRRRTLRGLKDTARRIAASLLDDYGGWDAAGLQTIRAYALSCERLEALQTAAVVDEPALHREVRANVQLLRALNLERAR